MHAVTVPGPTREFPPMFGWARLRVALLVSSIPWALLAWQWTSGPLSLFERTTSLGLLALAAFGVSERWPKRLPAWLARWALQVAAVGLIEPVGCFVIYVLSTKSGAPPFWEDSLRLQGFVGLSAIGALIAPWVALTALVRQKDALARTQALAFDLERSEYERRALDARLRLLQAQVEPHFLFNTLANVRELVDSGSAQASAVLNSLIAYLRAAVPRIHDTSTTLGQELDLVRAYLELMHMRMPDRLRFSLEVDEGVRRVTCPPMTLLTLVENAVRHGIDPAEEGGRIEVRARSLGGRCLCEVRDTGVGLRDASGGLGTGLATLRERIELAFGGDARLTVRAIEPHGVSAELEFPAWQGKP